MLPGQFILAGTPNTQVADNSFTWLIYFALALIFTSVIILVQSLLRLKKQKQQIARQNEQLNDYKKQNSALVNRIQTMLKKDDKLKGELKTSNKFQSSFLANISHEIRTPLNGIIGFTSLIKQNASKPSANSTIKNCDFILSCSHRVNDYIENLIEISRLQVKEINTHIGSCFVPEIINQIQQEQSFLLNQKGIKLSIQQLKLFAVKADKKLLYKVLKNIISNSIKYTASGTIQVNFLATNDTQTIEIIDSGTTPDLNHINRFWSLTEREQTESLSKIDGTTLGLAIAIKLIEHQNGTLKITSNKERGKTVSITLPVSTEQLQINSNPSYSPTKIKLPTNGIPRILVVEDEELNAELMKAYLAGKAETTIAEDGDSALSIIKEWADRGEYFDILLVDINLPDPWNGTSLMIEMKNRWSYYKNVPILCQTAHALHGDKEILLQNGFTDYIPKPINRRDLFLKIDEHCQHLTKTVTLS